MRIAAALVAVWALAHVTSAPAPAQGYGSIGTGPKLGELEIKAWQPIPKTKTAVQLGSDTRLGRELRRQVMVRLSQRGNEVGFSGSNVMRLDVSYFDLLGGSRQNYGELGERPAYAEPGSNPFLATPANPIGRNTGRTPSTAGPTLRISLSLYAVDTGKVLWSATASCVTQADIAQRAGEMMINNIFD
ncbi:MAG: hypothetical protein AAB398_01305, partial [Pseudomonadota bacterium]